MAQGGTVNIGVDGNKGNFIGNDLSLVGDVIVKATQISRLRSILESLVRISLGRFSL